MCFYGDGPALYRVRYQRARKPHECCECSQEILAGARYEHVVGIWDGDFGIFKTCLRCVRVREVIISIEQARGCDASESFPPHSCISNVISDEYNGIRGLIREARALGVTRPKVQA